MPLLIQYLLKLSIGLAVVWLFYQVFLRRLTFYAWNRWYLLFYTMLSFFIPFLDITSVLDNGRLDDSSIINLIPSVTAYTADASTLPGSSEPSWFMQWNKWEWAQFILFAGAVLYLLRFGIRIISFLRLKRKAKLLSSDGMALFHVDEPIIPFSFGNAIFINCNLHEQEDLKEIIRHEFVHVRQRHSIDIIWSEILCMVNWYNPFAWMIKSAIRQNLEFIADKQVLQYGIDRKQYQYLLLKVTGNNQFSIAAQFNFSSLKKRIVMMNKIQTAKVHLLRFMFILPLIAVILVSFRPQKQDATAPQTGLNPAAINDSIPPAVPVNKKGYHIFVTGNNGNSQVVVKDGNGKEIDRVPLVKWNEQRSRYEERYGEVPPPPPPPPYAARPEPPVIPQLPDNVQSINANNHKVTVTLKDGTKETYDLDRPGQKQEFEQKYGTLPPPPPPPAHAARPEPPIIPQLPENVKGIKGGNHKVTVTLKDGSLETYDLNKPAQKKEYEKKYGPIPPPPPPPPPPASGISALSVGEGGPSTAAATTGVSMGARYAAATGHGRIVASAGYSYSGEEETLLVITPATGQAELEGFITRMKEKGIEVKWDNISFRNGKLFTISGILKADDNNSQFHASDFTRIAISCVKDGDHRHFRIMTSGRTVI